ncbi:MAG: pyridoxal phosphate-dependent aminotransferase [Myxococcota bacterium]|nr:pyridoxal phosphate-dependent aminotransferase [Myxococcota bacterium]
MHPAASFRPVPRTGVIYVMTEAAKRGFSYGNPDWANLGQGAPEVEAIPGCIPRVEQIALETAVHEYSPVEGRLELRQAVADLYNARYRRGLSSQYSAENVAISPGGRSGLTRVAAALGNVHLGHLLPDYTAYEELLDIFRAFVPIPIVLDEQNGFHLSPEALRKAVVGGGLGAILLSNPCNPTGRLIQGEEMHQWVHLARELSCTLILDEFYSHYSYTPTPEGLSPARSAAAFVEDVDRDPVLLVDGMSKNWRYPGWRLSWTVGPRSIIEKIGSAGSFLDGGASHPIQQASLDLISVERADQEARAIQATFGAKRSLVIERLQAMGMELAVAPEGAFYTFPCLAQLPEPLQDGMAFFQAALENKVIVVPGVFFDVNPGKRRSHLPSRLRNHVRISFGPHIDTVALGLSRLEELISEHR